MSYNPYMDSLQYTPSYRASLIKKFGGRIPTTGEGLLTGFYRSDVLPHQPPGSVPTLVGYAAKTNEAAKDVTTNHQALGQDVDSDDPGSSAVSPQAAPTSGSLPKNDAPLGLAAGARPKKSAQEIEQDTQLAEQLRAAYVELNFDHGYPATPVGMPFWHKLDFEGGFAYAAFQIYLEAGDTGPRELHALSSNLELLQVARQQTKPDLTHTELNFMLQEYFILHYWYSRAKSFDLYKETALRHQRLRKQITTEDKHFNIAATILEKLQLYFAEPRFMDEMTPKTALDAFSKIVAIQRVSVGLPSTGPLSANQQPEATSFEMIMRNVAKHQGTAQVLNNGFGGGTAHTRDMIDQILTDPGAAASLQEVIIRISSVSSGVPDTPEKRFPGKQIQEVEVDESQVIEAELREIGAQTR